MHSRMLECLTDTIVLPRPFPDPIRLTSRLGLWYFFFLLLARVFALVGHAFALAAV